MKANVSAPDRMFRIALGIAILGAAFIWLNASQGAIPGVIAALLGAGLVVSGLSGYCALYRALGKSTCKTRTS